MGILLSVLVGCVGAVELVSCIHYISDEWLLHQLRTQNRGALENALTKYQDEIRQSIENLDHQYSENAKNMMMQDGIEYVNGYRKEDLDEELRLKFEEKLKEILKKSHLDEHESHHNQSKSHDDDVATRNSCEKLDDFEKVSVDDDNYERKRDELPQPTTTIHCDDNDGDIEVVNDDEKNDRENFVRVDVDEKHDEHNFNEQLLNNEVNDVDGAAAVLVNKQDFEKTQSLGKLTFDEYEGHSSHYDSEEQYNNDRSDEGASRDDIQGRRLLRDDGTGRRRAFKKRHSNDSEELKLSREEELKMFTSLEEAEFDSMKSNFNPIKYSSEPNLKMESGPKRRHHRHHKHLSESNILEMDEIDPLAVDDIGGDDVTHPWGDIKPEMRRDSGQWKKIRKASSIDEEPELQAEIESFLKSEKCADMVMAGCSTAMAEEANYRVSEPDSEQDSEDQEIGKSRNQKSKTHNEFPKDEKDSRKSHVSSSSDSHESFQHAVVVVSPSTTINITSNINDSKFEELTHRLQKIEQAIEMNISEWTTGQMDEEDSNQHHHHHHHHGHHHHNHHHLNMDESSYSSDEEPFYGDNHGRHKRHAHHHHHQHHHAIGGDDQLEIDFRQVLEDNDIEIDEDYSYLPIPHDRHHYVLHSDEEPWHGKRSHSAESDSDISSSEGSHYENTKRQKIRRHKRPVNIIKDSDAELSDRKHRHKRKSKSTSKSLITKPHTNYDMLDELSDSKDDKIVFVEKVGNEKEFLLDSDEEPFYGEMTKRRNAIVDVSPLTPETDHEYFMLHILDSDEEPDRHFKSQMEMMPSTPSPTVDYSVHPGFGDRPKFNNRMVIPMLGHVQQHTYDSDEEPIYRESNIVYDIPQNELRARCVIRLPSDMELKLRQRMYEENEIEENERYNYGPPLTYNDRLYTWDSDEEPNAEEQRAYEERMRRSKSPSRSPFCEHGLTQNFIDMERETEEEDRTTKYDTPTSPSINSNVIHLGLIGTTKRRDENSDGETRRRKYKWEESLESELGTYHRGELTPDVWSDNSRRESDVSGISMITEATETESMDANYYDRVDVTDDSYEDDSGDHAWASENDTTQKSVIERRLTLDIFSNSDIDNDIDEIQDEEVPNGNYSGVDETRAWSEEGATGLTKNTWSFNERISDTITVPQNSTRQSVDYDSFEFGDDVNKVTPTLRHSPKMYDFEKVEKVVEPPDETDKPIGRIFDETFQKIFEEKLKHEIEKEKIKDEMIQETEDTAQIVKDEEPVTTSTKSKTKTKKIVKKIKSKSKKSKSFDESKADDLVENESVNVVVDEEEIETRNFLVKEKDGTKVSETSSGSSLKLKFDKKQETQDFLAKEKEGDLDLHPQPGPSLKKSKSLDCDAGTKSSKVIGGFLPHEQNINETPIEIFDETLNDDDLLDPEEEILAGEQEPTSAIGGTKRKSIQRPDPIYLLKESMYPFY